MSEHPVANEIIKLLGSSNCWFETYTHEPVRTSEEAAQIRPEYTLAQGAKAIILRVKVGGQTKKFVMLVLPGDMKFNSSKTKDILKSRDIRFATEDEVVLVTKGVQPGGVPPFGNLFNLEVIVDTRLLKHKKIIFNAGRNFSIAMFSDDYIKFVSPTIADICD